MIAGSEEPGAAGHADRGNDEDAGRAGHAADAVAVMQNETGAEKADALDDIGRDLALVGCRLAGQHGGQEGKEGAAHADEQVGAHAGSTALPSRSRPMAPPRQQASSRRAMASLPRSRQPVRGQPKSKGRRGKRDVEVMLIILPRFSACRTRHASYSVCPMLSPGCGGC